MLNNKIWRYGKLRYDIGKVGIPDAILLKPGRLTKEEFEIMKTHCSFGSNILSGSNNELVQMAQEIAYNHHEKCLLPEVIKGIYNGKE